MFTRVCIILIDYQIQICIYHLKSKLGLSCFCIWKSVNEPNDEVFLNHSQSSHNLDSTITAIAQIPSYPPFDCKSDDTVIRWSKWISRLKINLFVANGITDLERKKELLLACGGNDLCDIVGSMRELEISPVEDESPFDKLVSALNSFFNAKVNKEIQRYKIRHTKQLSDTIDEIYTTLKQLASSCDCHNTDIEVKSQITRKVQKMVSQHQQCLCTTVLSLPGHMT